MVRRYKVRIYQKSKIKVRCVCVFIILFILSFFSFICIRNNLLHCKREKMKEKTKSNPLDYQIDCLIAESTVNDGVMEEGKAFLI